MTSMKVLSIDPGYDRLGVAILEYQAGKEFLIYSACIETTKSKSLNERLHEIRVAVSDLLETHQPTALAIETLFFNSNQKTALGVAAARGIVIYLAQAAGCHVYEFGPQEVKVAITGYGKSDKSGVISMIRKLLPQAPTKALDDEYDAIAVGITCLAHHGRNQ